MQQEVVLALLAKEPAHGHQLRARLDGALGPLGEGLNAGHIYVTLRRLEQAGLVTRAGPGAASGLADRKVYSLTAAGQERVTQWLGEIRWPRPDLTEFHLKLIAAAAAGLADPVSMIETQRSELLRRLRDTQLAAIDQPDHTDAALLLEGVALRLQADLRWLQACERRWTEDRSA